MKHLFTLALIFVSSQLFAQGTIQGLSVSPANPTVNDNITVYADVQFTSGSCDLDNQGSNLNGFSIMAYAHHCVGVATVICPVTDEFELGMLPAGDYTFDFTLTSGSGGPGRSPGIVAAGNDQLQFTVSTSVGIEEIDIDSDFAFPNPTSGKVFFKNPIKEISQLTDVRGKILLEVEVGSTEVDLSQLPSGIYFLISKTKRGKLVKN